MAHWGVLTVRETGTVVATRVRWATRFGERWKGFLGRDRVDPDEGIWFPHTRGVHMWGMHCDLAVIYLDRHYRVLVRRLLHPGQLGPWRWDAAHVVELAPPALALIDLGQHLVWTPAGGGGGA